MSDRFTDLVPIEPTGDDTFRIRPAGSGFLFGGLTMAMALRAAAATVPEGKVPKSFRATFLAGGDWGGAMDLAVERVNDSRAFAGRRVSLRQDDRLIAVADASFHVPEDGDDWHGAPAADVEPPESAGEHKVTVPLHVIEVRPAGRSPRADAERLHPYWSRPVEALEDPVLRACVALFTSDYLVIFSPFAPGSGTGVGVTARTLEHSVWFHRPLTGDGWWLYDAEPLSVAGGRFVSRGTVHGRDGALLASFVQEGFIR
jgi:acyl-CoA thioesterase-2